jgi:hypothetical protein
MYSYMLKHTTILPYRSIHLYILFFNSMSMDTPTSSVNVALAMVFAMTTSIMTKQAFAFEDPKHCNTDEVFLLQRRI